MTGLGNPITFIISLFCNHQIKILSEIMSCVLHERCIFVMQQVKFMRYRYYKTYLQYSMTLIAVRAPVIVSSKLLMSAMLIPFAFASMALEFT